MVLFRTVIYARIGTLPQNTMPYFKFHRKSWANEVVSARHYL